MKRMFKIVFCWVLTTLLFSATGCKHSKTTSYPAESMNMKPFQEPSYVQSLPLSLRNDLLKALNKAGDEKRIVKIPVVLHLNTDGLHGWQAAFLGTRVELDEEDKILLRLGDSALGLSLADRIQQYCPTGEWCKLWLTGYWAEDLPAIDEETGPHRFPFGIRAVIGQQADGAEALVYISGK